MTEEINESLANLSDDEKMILETNDELVEQELDFAAVNQLNDNMLLYHIEGLYKDENKTKYIGNRKLIKNPPILNIKASSGEEVNFTLTKEFVKSLSKSIKEVERAYSGYMYVAEKDRKQFTMKERINDLKERVKRHPILTVFTIVLFLAFIYLLSIPNN